MHQTYRWSRIGAAFKKALSVTSIAALLSTQVFSGVFLSLTFANAAVTAATGGDAISVETAPSGGSAGATILNPLIISEGSVGEITTGTVVVEAPDGFLFENAAGEGISVTATDADDGGSDNAMRIWSDASDSTQASVTLEADGVATFTLFVNAASDDSAGTVPAKLTFGNIRIQPISTTVATGNITVKNTSTSTIAGVTPGTTSLAAISSVAGTFDHYLVRAGDDTDSLSATVGADASVKVVPVDPYGNVTPGSANVNVVITSGPTGATLSRTTADTSMGTDTISDMRFDRVGTYELDVSDGSADSAGNSADDLGVTIAAGALASLAVVPATLTAGADDDLDVSFVTANAIPKDGKVFVDLPAGYDAAGAGVASISDGDAMTTEPTVASIAVTDGDGTNDKLEIVLGGDNSDVAAGKTVSFTVSSVRVPPVSGNPGNVTVATADGDGDRIDSVTADPVGDDAILAGAIMTADVEPTSLGVGAEGTVDVSFTTVNPIPADGKIAIDLPAGFSAADVANVTNANNVDGTFSVSAADGDGTADVVTIVRQGDGTPVASATAVSLRIDGVRNPSSAGSAGTYAIRTKNAAGADIDAKTDVSADTVVANAVTSGSVSLSTGSTSSVSVATVAFAVPDGIPGDGKIIIDFDNDFDLSGVGDGDISSSTLGGTFSVSLDGTDNVLTVTRVGGTPAVAGTYDLDIAGIVNPSASQTTDNYVLSTATSGGGIIDTKNDIAGSVITGVLTSANVQPASLIAGALSNVTVSFGSQQDIPEDGKIAIVFPAGYDISAVVDGDIASSSIGGTFSASVNGQTLTIVRQNNGPLVSSGPQTITIIHSHVRTPRVSGTTGTYSVTTLTASDDVIDTAPVVVGDTITAGALTGADVQPASLIAGASGNATVSFVTANPVPGNGKILVTFPAGFDLSGVSASDVSSDADIDGTFSVVHSGQTLVITRVTWTTLGANATVDDLVIAHVKNPPVSGAAGTYAIVTATVAGTAIDENSAIVSDTLTTGTISTASFDQTGLGVSQTTDATFGATLVNPLPANGIIWVKLPNDATHHYDISSVVAADVTVSNVTQDADLAVASIDVATADTIKITLNALAVSDAGDALTVAIGNRHLVNPAVAAATSAGEFRTFTASSVAIDAAAAIAGVTLVSSPSEADIQPVSLYAGASTNLYVQLRTSQSLPANGKIVLTLPTGYDVSGASSVYGVSGMNGTFSVSPDAMARTITITRQSDGTATNAGTQIRFYVASVTNPSSPGTTGAYVIATRTSGSALIEEDNSVTGDTVLASPDTTPPSVESIALDRPSYRLTQDPNVTVTVVEDNTASSVTINGASAVEGSAGVWTKTFAHGQAAVGDYSVTVVATDAFGNDVTRTMGYAVVADAETDTEAPIIASFGPATVRSSADPTIYLTATDDVTAADSLTVSYSVDGSAWTTMSYSGSRYEGASVIADGQSKTVMVRVSDAAGNSAYHAYLVSVDSNAADTVAPVVSAVAPTAVQADTAPTISVSYSDAGTIDTNRNALYVDGVPVTPSTNNSTTLSYTPASALADHSTHVVTYVVYDTAGNFATASFSFLVDSGSSDVTAPVFVLTPYAYDITQTGSKLKFKSNESGTYGLAVGTNASALSAVASGSMTANTLATADISSLAANTTYYYELTVTDAASNASVAGGSFRTNDYAAPAIGAFAFGGITATGVVITWENDSPSFGSEYRLSDSATMDGDRAQWFTAAVAGTGAMASATILRPATAYYVQVRNTKNGKTTVSPIYSFTTSSANTGIAVRSVVVMKNFGTADNTYMNGWQFRFNITVNDENERYLKFKLADWLGAASGSISSSGNTIGVNPINGVDPHAPYPDESTIVTSGYGIGTTYASQATPFLLIDSDPNTGGIQATFDIFVKLPASTAPTSFTSAYGIKTSTLTGSITD